MVRHDKFGENTFCSAPILSPILTCSSYSRAFADARSRLHANTMFYLTYTTTNPAFCIACSQFFLPICKLCLQPAPAAAPSSRTTGTAARFRCPPCPPSGARAAHSAAPPGCTPLVREHIREHLTRRAGNAEGQHAGLLLSGKALDFAFAGERTGKLMHQPSLLPGNVRRRDRPDKGDARRESRDAGHVRRAALERIRQKNPAGASPRTDCPFLRSAAASRQSERRAPAECPCPSVRTAPCVRACTPPQDTDSALRQSLPRPPTATHPG